MAQVRNDRESVVLASGAGAKGGFLSRNLLVICVSLGYAIGRTCLEIPLSFGAIPYTPEEIGKLIGLVVIVAVSLGINRSRNNVVANYLPSAFLILGCILVLVFDLVGPMAGTMTWLPAIVLGIGGSSTMIQWFEYCGGLPSRRIVITVALAFVLNSVFVLALQVIGSKYVLGVITIGLSLASLAMFMYCKRNAGFEVGLGSFPRRLPERRIDFLPIDIVLWAVVVGSTFGIIENRATGIIMGASIDNLARMVPCLVVLVGYIFFSDRFDMKFLYAATLPLLVAGLALTGYSDISSDIPQFFFCMGAAACRLIVYSLVCIRAHQLRISSLIGAATVMFLNVGTHDLSVLLNASSLVNNNELVLVVAIIIDVTVIVFLFMHEAEHFQFIDQLRDASGTSGDAVGEFVADRELSPREATVFMHMLAGESNAEIGDDLFISSGAVRSHTSRIYEKLGVHSRQEFDDMVGGLKREVAAPMQGASTGRGLDRS